MKPTGGYEPPHPFVAIVLARRGSKSVEEKNLREIGGTSMVSRAIHAGHLLEASEVYVSTDYRRSELMASHDFRYLRRPDSLCGDAVSSWEVIENVVESVDGIDWFLLLQPTSPLRPRGHGIRFLERAQWVRGVLSQEVFPVGRSPSKYGTVEGDRFIPFVNSCVKNSNRQEAPYAYAPSGRFYLFDRTVVRKMARDESTPITPVITPCFTTVDIDSLADLGCAMRLSSKFQSII